MKKNKLVSWIIRLGSVALVAVITGKIGSTVSTQPSTQVNQVSNPQSSSSSSSNQSNSTQSDANQSNSNQSASNSNGMDQQQDPNSSSDQGSFFNPPNTSQGNGNDTRTGGS